MCCVGVASVRAVRSRVTDERINGFPLLRARMNTTLNLPRKLLQLHYNLPIVFSCTTSTTIHAIIVIIISMAAAYGGEILSVHTLSEGERESKRGSRREGRDERVGRGLYERASE